MIYDFDEIIHREHTNCVKYDLRNEYFGKEDVIPMWVADMDFAVPPFVREALRKRAEHPVYGYTVLSDSYYRSIINWLEKKHHWKIQKEWISYSPGIVTALNLLVQAFSGPGDSVIVQPPVYFPFFNAVKTNNRKLVYNQLLEIDNRYFIDFDDLQKKAEEGARMLLLCSPHNPVGRTWTKEELERLGAWSLKYGVLIISDEIHADLVFEPFKHIPFAGMSEELSQNTISCIAPSKTFNLAGLSTSSVIISDKELRKKYSKTTERVHLSNNIFGAIASEAAYTHGYEWLQQLMGYLQNNVNLVTRYFRDHLPEVKVTRPEATYLLWLDFRGLKIQN